MHKIQHQRCKPPSGLCVQSLTQQNTLNFWVFFKQNKVILFNLISSFKKCYTIFSSFPSVIRRNKTVFSGIKESYRKNYSNWFPQFIKTRIIFTGKKNARYKMIPSHCSLYLTLIYTYVLNCHLSKQLKNILDTGKESKGIALVLFFSWIRSFSLLCMKKLWQVSKLSQMHFLYLAP